MAIGRDGKPTRETEGYARSLNRLRGLRHLLIPADVNSDEEYNDTVDAICKTLQKTKLDVPSDERKEPNDKPNRMHEGGLDRSVSE